jgi:hypothetical protein
VSAEVSKVVPLMDTLAYIKGSLFTSWSKTKPIMDPECCAKQKPEKRIAKKNINCIIKRWHK